MPSAASPIVAGCASIASSGTRRPATASSYFEGTTTRYSSGDTKQDLFRVAWVPGNAQNSTHPVGEKAANPFGLHDMHGNVWEWVEDCYHRSYEGAPDDGSPRLEEGGGCSARVLRGGSWYLSADDCRAASRHDGGPGFRSGGVGFRVLCSPPS